MTKTNDMRQLDRAKITYEVQCYEYDESDLSGVHAAQALGMPPEQIFKTLVTRGEKKGLQVFCIPVDATLDLKKAARVSGDKKIEMIAVKDLQALTGYIRGGCSLIGMKKLYRTYLDETALCFDRIGVSAGARGQQILVDPEDLIRFVPMQAADLTLSYKGE